MEFLSGIFVTPLFLIGVVTAAIPIILHLIYKKRAPKIFFSTVRFLRMSVERTAHRQRIQELLLLILRALVLALLAIGLAGPFIRSSRLGSKGNTAAVLIMDNSFSMATEQEGRTRYARAKELARKVLSELGEGSMAALIFTNGVGTASESEVSSLLQTLTSDRQAISGQIGLSEVSAAPGELTTAILRAREILAQSKHPNQEIYVFTDMQKLPWRTLSPEQSQNQPGADIPVIVVNCGDTAFRNVAVTEVSVRSKGRATGVPITIEAKLFNTSPEPARNVPVSLYVDKQKRQQKSVDVGAQGSTIVAFTDTFEQPGTRTGWVSLEWNDSLPFDDQRYFALDVAERIRVLVVKDADSAVPLLDEAFYLIPAFDPSRAGITDVRSVIEPTSITLSALRNTRLTDFVAIFIVNVHTLTVHHVNALISFLEAGGNLVFFLGDAVDRENYNTLGGERLAKEGGLLPARLEGVMGDPEDRDKFQHLAEVDFGHPIFLGFKGLQSSVFERIHIYRWHKLSIPQGTQARILAALANGDPFLVEKPVLNGRVLMFAVPPTTRWTNFPVRTLFLPTMHQIVYYLIGWREQTANYVAGSPARIPIDAEKGRPEVEVTDPHGRVRRAQIPEEGKTPFAIYYDTYVPGVYQWRSSAGSEGAFVVNPDPTESDLSVAKQDEVRASLTPARVYFADDIETIRKILTSLREGLQLWNAVLFLVLAVAIIECFLANRMRTAAPAARAEPARKAA